MRSSGKWLASDLLLAVGMAAACDESTTDPSNSPLSVSMNAVSGSGVSGTASITDLAGDVSRVTITLQGMTPGSSHAGHVHRGSCANQGAIDFGLEPVVADAQGNGSATASNVPDGLLTSGFYLQYHVALNPPGAPIACGDITAAAPPYVY